MKSKKRDEAGVAGITGVAGAEASPALELVDVDEMSKLEMLEELDLRDPGADYSSYTIAELRVELRAARECGDEPYDPEKDVEPTPQEIETAVNEAIASAPLPATPIEVDSTRSADLAELEDVKRTLEALTARPAAATSKPTKGLASGSKPRPNVKYTLMARAPGWTKTPQVEQLTNILFGQPKREMMEPELFQLLETGKKSGLLRTIQPAVRIFQYYRAEMVAANVLRYQ
jgi:hypothetical protein